MTRSIVHDGFACSYPEEQQHCHFPSLLLLPTEEWQWSNFTSSLAAGDNLGGWFHVSVFRGKWKHFEKL